jgi:hypothetical protein
MGSGSYKLGRGASLSDRSTVSDTIVPETYASPITPTKTTRRRWVRGRNWGRATALVVAATTCDLLDSVHPHGVVPSHETFGGATVERPLETGGYRVGGEWTTDG